MRRRVEITLRVPNGSWTSDYREAYIEIDDDQYDFRGKIPEATRDNRIKYIMRLIQEELEAIYL